MGYFRGLKAYLFFKSWFKCGSGNNPEQIMTVVASLSECLLCQQKSSNPDTGDSISVCFLGASG